jgi:hypothetical protein
VIVRKVLVVLAAVLATVIGLALVLSRENVDSGSDRARNAAGAVPLTPIPTRLRRGDPPLGLDDVVVAASYRELAAFRSRRGTLVYVFVGRSRRHGTSCVGLRNASGAGVSCGPAFENGGLTHVHRSQFAGESFVSGVAVSSVAIVEVSDGRRLTRRVRVANGAFAVQGRSAAVVGALDQAGRYVDR